MDDPIRQTRCLMRGVKVEVCSKRTRLSDASCKRAHTFILSVTYLYLMSPLPLVAVWSVWGSH